MMSDWFRYLHKLLTICIRIIQRIDNVLVIDVEAELIVLQRDFDHVQHRNEVGQLVWWSRGPVFSQIGE